MLFNFNYDVRLGTYVDPARPRFSDFSESRCTRPQPVVVMDSPVFILENLRDILDRSIVVSPKSVKIIARP